MAEHESTMLDIISEVQEEQILLQQHRETFLLPYMNIETLSKDGSRLLRLLFHRVKHLPEEFVTFDNRQLLTGWHIGAFEERFNPGCVIMYGPSLGRWKTFSATDGTCFRGDEACTG